MYQAYGGVWDTIQGFLDEIGITAQTSAAVAKAFASPSWQNIEAVKSAFRAEGTTVPPEILDALYKRYYSAVEQYPSAYAGTMLGNLGNLFPWILLGGLGLILLSRGRK